MCIRDSKYSVPYTWGTVGIIYNTKYVDKADVTGWELLWNEKYAGKILMLSLIHISMCIRDREISYGGTFVTTRPTVVATVPIGYADGYRRSLSGKFYVLIHGPVSYTHLAAHSVRLL